MDTHAPALPEGAINLSGRTFYVPGLTNSGHIDGLAIDTGPEESVYASANIDTLVVTHGHADHFACGAYLRRRGARVIAARDDASLIENPEVNLRGMFSWANPADLLVGKLFRGEPCEVDELIEGWDDPRATPVPLHGHTLGHTGVLTADSVLFSGDALYERDIWLRHPLPYAIDPGMVVASLRSLARIEFEWLVPGHGEPVRREEALLHAEHHISQVLAIEELLRTRLVEAHTTEGAIALVSEARGLSDKPSQYWLAVTTVKGFLGDMLSRGELEFFVRDHAGWWQATR